MTEDSRQAGAIELISDYLSAYYEQCALDVVTGDPEFDAAFDQRDHAKILLSRLESIIFS